MDYNLLFTIIPNVLLGIVLLIQIISGARRGVLRTSIKLGMLAATAVGAFFLMPVVANALLGIAEASVGGFITFTTIKALTYSLLVLVIYLVLDIIYGIINRIIINNKKKRLAKTVKQQVVKVRAVNGHSKAELRHQEKEAKKARKKEVRKQLKALQRKTVCSRIFGAIVGIVGAVVIGFVIMLPIRQIVNDENIQQLKEIPVEEVSNIIESAPTIYNNTPYGLLENNTNINIADFIIGE